MHSPTSTSSHGVERNPTLPATERRPRRSAAYRSILTVGAAFSAVALLVALAGLLVDHREITGAPAWVKPAKFAVSLTLYLLTLRWMLSQVRGHRVVRTAIAGVTTVAAVGELVLIDVQVARGTTSHFNHATPFDTAVFDTMGKLVTLIFVATVLTAVLALRRGRLDAALAAGLRWGLGVCLLGMAEAVLMIVNHRSSATGGHTVGAPDGGPGLPLLGWSTLHGDLRIAHFVGLHALQTLPLLAWALAHRTTLDSRARVRLVAVAGLAQAALVVLLAWQAMRGQALLRPDATSALAVAVLVVLTTSAVALVLRRHHPPTTSSSEPSGPER